MAPTDGRQPPAHPEFGPLLTELRLARGMAQRALAEAAADFAERYPRSQAARPAS